MNKVALSAWAIVAAVGAVGVTACGSPAADTGRDKKGISGYDAGSPNDPGWVPPGAQSTSPDDTVAQPGTGGEGEGASCTPLTATDAPQGWTKYAMHHFSFDARSTWAVETRIDDNVDPKVSPFFAVMALAGGGFSLRATEEVLTQTPDEWIAATKAYFASHGGTGEFTVTYTTSTFGCDPAATATLDGAQGRNDALSHLRWTAVFHAGRVFGMQCAGSDSTAASVCAQAEASLRVTL